MIMYAHEICYKKLSKNHRTINVWQPTSRHNTFDKNKKNNEEVFLFVCLFIYVLFIIVLVVVIIYVCIEKAWEIFLIKS